MKILLTGAGGMVGRNILEHPAASARTFLAPRSRELDLTQPAQVREYLAHHKPDLIIHAAARVGGIQANIRHPVEFLTQNLDINLTLIREARAAGVRRLLNLGSSCMYPRGVDTLLTEEMILTGELEPTNEGYALSKIVAERLCRYINREDPSFQYKTIIPSNLFGRHDDFTIERSHLVPAVIRKTHEAVQAGTQEIDIWGDGTARREFMSASDLADFIFYYIENFDRAPELLNVGLGHDHTVNEYYQIAAEVIGYRGQFKHDLSKPVGMKRKVVSTARLEKFGWKAKTPIKDGLRQAYEFFLASEKEKAKT